MLVFITVTKCSGMNFLGVTYYDIDFKAKKLTVVGDVTPLAVLASVSKVKNAQLLTLPLASSVCSNISEIQKGRGIVL